MATSDSQIVKLLKTWQSKQSNLHEHLCQLLTNPSVDKINSLSHFQRISQFHKRTKFSHREHLTQPQIKSQSHNSSSNSNKVSYPSWLISQQEQIKNIKKMEIKSSGRIVQNFKRISENLFEPVGICFGYDQNQKINLALRLIGERENAINLRFWGKILTTHGDYFVIQGVAKKVKQPEISQGMEKYRQGVNYYSFWVSKKIIDENWYQLPLISPEQLKISRQIKHIFSGNLNQKITSYPPFPGEERHLLKCQLVRISHNCQIAPNGLYSKQEQNQQQIDFSQQYKMPQFADLTNLQNWVHVNPYILGVGRADYYKDPKLSEEQRDEQLNKLQETDPKIERLKGINQDKPIQKLGMEGCWIAKQVGNLQIFSGKEEGSTACYGAVVLKNPHWPGWQTVANSKYFGSIYIGYGYKLTQDSFYPLSPQDLQVQGNEMDQFDEPNPKNPPDQLQPDSDQQNKKPQDS